MFKWIKNIGRGIVNLSSGLANPARWFLDALGGGNSDSGITVNGKTALTYAPVWQANNVIAGDVSQLPVFVVKHNGDNRERVREHPGFRLLHGRPNDVMTSQTFKMTLQSHALMWGNGYAVINRRGGRPEELLPLLPDRTWPVVEDGTLGYMSKIDGKDVPFSPMDILHIKGLGFDGLVGHSVIALARNSWGLGMAAEKNGGSFFKNSSRPSGVLQHPGKFRNPEAGEKLRKNWEALHQGVDNAMRVAILEEGMTFNPMSMSNKDSQWLEARQFQRIDVASWFNLPPWKLGADVATSYSSLEVQSQAYLNQALMRWLVTWEEELTFKLLTEVEKRSGDFEFKFSTAPLLRGDTKSRFEAYAIGKQWGVWSTNDIRAMEDVNGIGDDGDDYWRPANMAIVGEEPPEPEPLQLPPPEEPEEEDEPEPPNVPTGSLRELVRDRMMRMLAIEQKAIRKACKAENFLEACRAFYDGRATTVYVESVSRVLAVAEDVTGGQFRSADDLWESHSYESKMRIRELSGCCVLSGLASAVDAELETWPQRIDDTINQLFPEGEKQ
jgi:HK97 family phage portal protein